MELYESQDYGEYLRFRVERDGQARGYLTKIAQAAGCQKSYLSLVLKGESHFTPEHAVGVAQFWDFNQRETEFFLQLVHLGRTSFPALKKQIQEQLRKLRSEQKSVTERFLQSAIPDLERQGLYYSSWLPSAVHVLLDIPEFRTVDAIAKRLKVSPLEVRHCLENLEKVGVAKKQGANWLQGSTHVHLPRQSPFTSTNHRNWRIQAVLDSELSHGQGLHYTSVQTLSKEDVVKVRELVLDFIEKQRKIVAPSRSEEIACFLCDWFVLGG